MTTRYKPTPPPLIDRIALWLLSAAVFASILGTIVWYVYTRLKGIA